MTEDALQHELDCPGGQLFKNNGYFVPLHRRSPTGKWKTKGKRTTETKTRS